MSSWHTSITCTNKHCGQEPLLKIVYIKLRHGKVTTHLIFLRNGFLQPCRNFSGGLSQRPLGNGWKFTSHNFKWMSGIGSTAGNPNGLYDNTTKITTSKRLCLLSIGIFQPYQSDTGRLCVLEQWQIRCALYCWVILSPSNTTEYGTQSEGKIKTLFGLWTHITGELWGVFFQSSLEERYRDIIVQNLYHMYWIGSQIIVNWYIYIKKNRTLSTNHNYTSLYYTGSDRDHVAEQIPGIRVFDCSICKPDWQYWRVSCVIYLESSFKSSPSSAAFMRRGSGSALVEVMVCCLFGTKPLPEPVVTCCLLDPEGLTSVELE